MEYNDNYFMELAYKEALIAYKHNDVPVGCVIVKDNKVISKAHNTKEIFNRAFNHAEINAINIATRRVKSWNLEGCTLYVTLEPCVMCAGLILQSRIAKVVYAAKEPKFGSFGSILNINDESYHFNHHVILVSGVLEDKCSNLLKEFFKNLREKKKK